MAQVGLDPRETLDMIRKIEQSNFNKEIMDTAQPSVLLFKNDNCHWCTALDPVYKSLSRKYKAIFAFYETDYHNNRELVELLETDGSPTIYIFTDEPYGDGDERSRNVIEVPFPDEPPETGYSMETLEEYLDYCAPLEENNG